MSKIKTQERLQASSGANPHSLDIDYNDKMPLYFNPSGTVVFVGLAHILPEDVKWRKSHSKIKAMACLENDNFCHCPWGCMEKLATRCHLLAHRFPDLQKILILFSRGEKPLVRNQDMLLSDTERQIDQARENSKRYRNPRIFTLVVNTDPLEIQSFNRANYDLLDFFVNKTEMVMTEKILVEE